MNKKSNTDLLEQSALWLQFQKKNQLSDFQLGQFKQYAQLLINWNKKFNITAITDLKAIIEYHFQDSLNAISFIDFTQVRGGADIGTGGGFPGMPIKITYPDLFTVLIEVNQKKINFLHEVIAELGLHNIEICSLDWRTFLRKTSYSIDLFYARASLSIEELIRMFRPGTPYANAQLVYWASRHYIPEQKYADYVFRQERYIINGTERKLIFFKKRLNST